VHVNRAPKINPNNWVILRSLIFQPPIFNLSRANNPFGSKLPGGAEELQPANFNGLASVQGRQAKSAADFPARME
jgi:hypothetical protein